MQDVIAALLAAPVAERIFVVSSSLACMAAIAMVCARPAAFSIASRAYGARLLRPWRLLTFLPPAAVFVFGAPYMGDPTWDHAVGAMMSVFTYLFAPWSAGTLFRVVRRRARAAEAFVAVAAWLLAVSVCYVTYLLLRDGRVPPTLWSNLVTSSTAFFAGGLFWSLTHVRDRGVVFAFMLEGWPHGEEDRRITSRMAVVALLLAAVVLLVLWPFVADRL